MDIDYSPTLSDFYRNNIYIYFYVKHFFSHNIQMSKHKKPLNDQKTDSNQLAFKEMIV